ncbi:MAG: bestrophin family ion channel [Thermodesulfobacteriota bacterium]|nr:bestrophin family ion channel [Thermodesulfobacteriota bacterium]
MLAYLLNEYILKSYFEFPSIIPAILGPALAFFIGFNNNQAYDRWWEARKIWGAIVNDSRSWARQLICYSSVADSEAEEELNGIKKRAIIRHIAFLYALKDNLRGENKKDYRKYLSQKESEAVELESNIHNAILTEQSKDLEYLYKKGWVDGFRFIELAILNPFEPIPSGIPLDQITRTIEINLLEALGESDIPEPIRSVRKEYIM